MHLNSTGCLEVNRQDWAHRNPQLLMIFPSDFVTFPVTCGAVLLVWQCAIAPRGATAAVEIPWNNGTLKAAIYNGTVRHRVKKPPTYSTTHFFLEKTCPVYLGAIWSHLVLLSAKGWPHIWALLLFWSNAVYCTEMLQSTSRYSIHVCLRPSLKHVPMENSCGTWGLSRDSWRQVWI